MADSIHDNHKQVLGAMFNLPSSPATASTQSFDRDSLMTTPPPPPMQARPNVQAVTNEVRAPPPLKLMSAGSSTENKDSSSETEGDEEEIPDASSIFAPLGKRSSLDSVVGKLIATKQTSDVLLDFSASTASPTASDVSLGTHDAAMVTPPPLRKCVPSPDPLKSRRKQSSPQATNDRMTESPPRTDTVQVPGMASSTCN